MRIVECTTAGQLVHLLIGICLCMLDLASFSTFSDIGVPGDVLASLPAAR